MSKGLVARSNGALSLTTEGRTAAGKLFAARHKWLTELLADWSPQQHAELAELLNKLCRSILGADADRHLAER